ncbi:MAG: 3-keto-5-aminohexanoate cleavage protein [Acidimicrobiia bacterium]
MQRDAALIEVGLNEATMRAQNPNVAYSPTECADDATRCFEAGAAVVHWHARDGVTGEQRLGNAQLSGEALDLMRAAGGLAYPSYPVDIPVEQRLDHVWTLQERNGLEIAPVDIGSVSVVIWDERSHDLVGVEASWERGVVANPIAFTVDALERAGKLGMVPSLGAFDLGFTRTMVLLHESGRLAAPVFLKIFLSGAWAVGPFPSEEAIDFHLRQIPTDLDVEWVVVPYSLADAALIERLSRHALARGGGIRVGIGDNPAAYPNATNAELVERAVGWCADAGRAVATTADVRERFALG